MLHACKKASQVVGLPLVELLPQLPVLLSPSAARLQQALEDAQTSFADSKATSDIGASGFSSDDATGGRTTGERTFVTIIVLVFPVKLYSDTLTLNLCVWPMV
ncbi:hypothetical protein F2Q68_00009858 [Brassica cretica]|uniref:Uncharacterized protein n=1 Tax=Brassica cretica TaxID=69181 RepID=A0A8S9L0Z3_BRACR|nr:hypothetical protein F2Q68_00009858 [Brassica cretica]